jgi:hypothetical protein
VSIQIPHSLVIIKSLENTEFQTFYICHVERSNLLRFFDSCFKLFNDAFLICIVSNGRMIVNDDLERLSK